MNFNQILKTTVAFLFSFSVVVNISAQATFGNEWINYSQDYFKVKVYNNGIHRITKNNLTNSGINLNNINNIQLYNNGIEQPMYIHTNNDTVDYIEFYGEKNDGALDAALYNSLENHLNPYYSLYSDTAIYFLTVGNHPGLRYENINASLIGAPTKESNFIQEDLVDVEKTWNSGTKWLISGVTFNRSFYETGEGWGSGEAIQLNYPHTLNTNILNQQIEVEIRIAYVGEVMHQPVIRVNGNIGFTDSYFGETTKTIKFNTTVNSKQLNISITGAGEKYVVGYIKLKYRKEFDFNNQSSYTFNVNGNNQRKFLEITDFKNDNNTQEIFLYDLTTKKRINCLWSNSKVYTDLTASPGVKKLVLMSNHTNSYFTASKIDKTRFTDYRYHNGDLLIVKHKNVQYYNGRDLILEYAAHKSSLGFNPVVIDIEEVINQFGYGVNNHPQSIRNLFKFTDNSWNNLKYVFFIGKGRNYNEVREFNTYDNIIPTFGHPASDNMFFSENGIINVPVAIGRLSVSNSQEFKNYFDKLVEMETPKTLPYANKIIHLSGGNGLNEEISFRNSILDLEISALESGYDVTAFSNVITNNDKDLYTEINSGAILMTYLGHANPLNLEYDGDSIEAYSNKSKYPFFISLSCKNGNYLMEGNQMSETFTLAADKGFIGYLGFSTDVTLYGATSIADGIYNQLYLPNISIGEMIQKSVKNLQHSNSIIMELALHSLILNGDPTYTINKINYSVNEVVEEANESTIVSNVIDVATDIKLNIYPNPMFETLTIDFNNNTVNNIQIVDISGRTVKIFKNTLNETLIKWNGLDANSNKLNPGIYNIICYGENKIIASKSVIVK